MNIETFADKFELKPRTLLLEFIEEQSNKLNLPTEEILKAITPVINSEAISVSGQDELNKALLAKLADSVIKEQFSAELEKLSRGVLVTPMANSAYQRCNVLPPLTPMQNNGV
ncbi:MAG: hypothetical protein ACI8WB_004517 [Phenylobacterium sp.]|jgi:hypothetical protein